MALERVDKVLAKLGMGSRKDIKKFCRQGLVTIDGELIKDSSYKFNPKEAALAFDGQLVDYREFIYVVLNKPTGVVSATEDNLHRTVVDILPEAYQVFDPFPVGRLDIDTEGLLLVTNDGQLAHRLLSPKHQVPKTYYVEVSQALTRSAYAQLEAGVTLDDGYETLPARVDLLESESDLMTLPAEVQGLVRQRWSGPPTPNISGGAGIDLDQEASRALLLTISEGKFHQVKRMIQAVGSQVTYLRRISMGDLILDESLPLGSCRELSEEELAKLMNL